MTQSFLLRLLAAIMATQLAIYASGAVACIYMGVRLEKAVCADFDGNLQRTFETATATILALLVKPGSSR